MSLNSEKNQTVNVEPPEVNLAAPRLFEGISSWVVVAKNRRINRTWEELLLKAPESTKRCYIHLCESPTTRQQGKVFPLKGKKYKGCWEYEVTGGDRVFYVPDESRKKVIVYYAGSHCSPAPTP